MAECLEVLCEASLEEQQEEVTVLQSIFEDDLQILQGGDGKTNICFNLTVKVNIPYDVLDFEAFIPVEVFEGLPVKRVNVASSSGSDWEKALGNHCKVDKESGTSSGNLFSTNHLDAQEIGLGASSMGKIENHTLPQPSTNSFSRRIKPGFTRSVSLQHWHVRAEIRYLTPIRLTCTFPPLYPTECPPEFSLACLWLTRSQLKQLQEKLMRLWTETPSLPIVFTWADWLQNYAYEYLNLGPHLVLKESECKAMPAGTNSQGFTQSENNFNTELETALLTIFEYSVEMQRQAFRQSTHLCEICFDEKDGGEFHYLDECRHFFCTDCLKAHCDLHVDGGTVLKLLCPSHDCKTTIPPEILREVLDAEKLERWARLLLSKTLNVMGDVAYCPRCNLAVVVDEDETSRLGHCANCFYAFCTEYYASWHHGQPCAADTDTDSDDEDNRKIEEEEDATAAERTRKCELCTTERSSAELHYLYECIHFFCTECLRTYCQWLVDRGTLLNLQCPIRDCKATISLEILHEVLDEKRFDRCEKMSLAKTLEDLGIGDVDYCPRCTVAVVVDEAKGSRHGHCPNCIFEFCTECYEPWHHR